MNGLIFFVVAVGTLSKAIAHSRELFKTATLSNAASIMTFHNHLSGELLEIQLLDHLIIGDGSFMP